MLDAPGSTSDYLKKLQVIGSPEVGGDTHPEVILAKL